MGREGDDSRERRGLRMAGTRTFRPTFQTGRGREERDGKRKRAEVG